MSDLLKRLESKTPLVKNEDGTYTAQVMVFGQVGLDGTLFVREGFERLLDPENQKNNFLERLKKGVMLCEVRPLPRFDDLTNMDDRHARYNTIDFENTGARIVDVLIKDDRLFVTVAPAGPMQHLLDLPDTSLAIRGMVTIDSRGDIARSLIHEIVTWDLISLDKQKDILMEVEKRSEVERTNAEYAEPAISENAPADVEAGPGIYEGPHDVNPIPEALATLKEAMVGDSDYAWTWQCNIAMPLMDYLKAMNVNISHFEANDLAASLMRHLFDVKIEETDEYKALIVQIAKNDVDEETMLKRYTAAIQSGEQLAPELLEFANDQIQTRVQGLASTLARDKILSGLQTPDVRDDSFKIQTWLRLFLTMVRRLGYIVNVDQLAQQPFRMGAHTDVVSVRAVYDTVAEAAKRDAAAKAQEEQQ